MRRIFFALETAADSSLANRLEVMTDLEQSKYQNCEWRISIYGRNLDEWDKLAKWVIKNKLFSHNVRWLIQVPRLYDIYKKTGIVETFEDVLRSKHV